MYEFSFTDEKNQDDQVYNDNILIDSISMPFVTNSQIDFSKSLMRREFIIQNPNAKKSCGCNRSFS